MIESMGLKELGRVLRERRGAMPQEELADLANVSQGIISKMERGEVKNPSEAKLRAIARALGVPSSEFFAAWHGSPASLAFEENMQASRENYLDLLHDIEVRWQILDLPPDVTTGELVMLKHLFRGIRSAEVDLAEQRERYVGDPPPLEGDEKRHA